MLTSILSIIILMLGVVPQPAGQKKIIYSPGAKAGGNFSPGILVDGSLYVSGMLGLDANGKIPDTFEAEVQQSLNNIDGVLKAAGMSREDVVSVQVYLTDLNNFQRMNAVYAAHFKDPRPTRTTVGVAGLVNGGHIEITVTARK
ncbi:MAG TPA: RidA family protein [Pyrinomonadaceae bacterium]|jgi:2-iminobutanoate/2-iminopropanoate deaminase|nr:RidA family protein [Pyrinomonadaceae bacterium]